MSIDETKNYSFVLRMRECEDQPPGFFETDNQTFLQVLVRYLDDEERRECLQGQTATRVPLALVVKWQDAYPFFTQEDWEREHRPQEDRLHLSRGPYFQVGNEVSLLPRAAAYLNTAVGQRYTVVEVFDHRAEDVEMGGLPEYQDSLGRVYRLHGLPALVSHQVLQRDEPPVLERLFRWHQKNDVRIVSYAPYTQRQAVSLAPFWDNAPEKGDWLNWYGLNHKPLYLYFTVEQARAVLTASHHWETVAFLEHATTNPLSGEVESVYACAPDGRRLWEFWYSPWEEDEDWRLFFDCVDEDSSPV